MKVGSFKQIKELSTSNLILIILNENCNDRLRKFSEIELKTRLKHVGWNYNDLLHFDDKVIKERGLNVDNYLLSNYVNMQQLMETFFLYDFNKEYDENMLLFSEKHICNVIDFNEPFFRNICNKEIKNIDKRIENTSDDSLKQSLLQVKKLLLERQLISSQEKKELFKYGFDVLPGGNEAMYQLDSTCNTYHEFYSNVSDEETYKILCSKSKSLKVSVAELLNDTLFDLDIMQSLYGLYFSKRDSNKLKQQKRILMNQVNNNYEVDYQSDNMNKALKKIKTLNSVYK